MEGISFLFDVSTFRTNASGTTTGTIWMEIAGRAHPEAGWRDFPLVIVSWWLRAVRDLEAGALSRSLDFMDGRCPLVLTRIEGDLFGAAGWDGNRRLFEAQVRLGEVAVKLRRLVEAMEAESGLPMVG